VLYFANPCTADVVADMKAGRLAYIDTPKQGNRRPAGVTWIADNGCFSDAWDADTWWRWLTRQDPADCVFAVAPDVVGDAAATARRAAPWLPRIRAAGFPVAYVAQDGLSVGTCPWGRIDALFVGGTTGWKLGPEAAALVAAAKHLGIWVHMGRVNSQRRYNYARSIGCDSVDGTCLTRGPDVNRPRVLSWVRSAGQPFLWASPVAEVVVGPVEVEER